MKLRSRQPESADINLTPLIDVVFLLLIFFMVSTTFNRESELTIELPEATTEEKQSETPSIEVAIDAQGRFYINNVQLVNTQMKTVKQALVKAANGRESPLLVINADAQTPHQAVVTAMDAARQLGFLNLTFATRLNPEGG